MNWQMATTTSEDNGQKISKIFLDGLTQAHLQSPWIMMFQVHLTLSLTTPFPIEYIIEAAEHVYDPTRFDQEMDEASEDDSDDSDTTSDSDSEE